MKTALLFLTLILAVALTSSSSTTAANATKTKHRALTTFTEPVKLMGVMLKGEYLFVHDDEAMARGDACTFVYKGAVESKKNLVLSFHCTPAPRAWVANFTIRTYKLSSEVNEVREFQFAGETETHLVPVQYVIDRQQRVPVAVLAP